MLLAFPPDAVHASGLSDQDDDEDPHERSSAQILQFDDYYSPVAVTQTAKIMRFPITVDETLDDTVQQLMQETCGDAITELSIEALPKKHQLKIWISVKASAYNTAFNILIRKLVSAEFGTATAVPTC